MKALPMKLRAQIPSMNITTAPALLGDRGDAGVALPWCSVVPKPFALRSQRGEQPGAQHRPGPRQTGKEGVVGMGGIGLRDLLIKGGNGLLGQLQLAADQLDAQAKAFQDAR